MSCCVRLAVELSGHVTVYDSLDHEISGISQQQADSHNLLGDATARPIRFQAANIVGDGSSAQSRVAVITAELHSGPMDAQFAASTVNCPAIAARKDVKNVHC